MTRRTNADKKVTTAPAKEAVSKSFRDFNVQRSVVDNFQKVDFTYPGVGETGHYLMIRSRYSEQYRNAEAKATRQVRALSLAKGEGVQLDEEVLKGIQDIAFASLVESWSFEEECNTTNVVEFFEANPHMYDIVNVTAAQDELFFAKRVSN